jgi:hypothetical protein
MQVNKENKFIQSKGLNCIFLLDTENKTIRFSSEVEAVKFCIKNEIFEDLQVFYKYEWADYKNDLLSDLPEPIDIFNVQDSIHFSWILADFERESRNHITMH